MQSDDFVMIALVAVVCGTLAQITSAYSKGGWIVNLGVAFAGALTGVFLSRLLNAPSIYDVRFREVDFPIIYSIVGAALMLAAINFLVRPGRH
jgi:uncharacterized membrane protein YeaQ/YmgE (transglycosylase-associated protein family)